MESTQSQPERYQYQRLGDHQIRILTVQQDNANDIVSAEMSIEELDEEITSYCTLSWEWGRQDASEIIHIKNRGSTEYGIWYLKPTLLAALKTLRQSDRKVRLWVDALCIDQVVQADELPKVKEKKNLEESKQISMMTTIYGMAEVVHIWLGEESDDSADTMAFIDKLVNLEDTQRISVPEQSTVNPLEALLKLLKRGWFGRRWVVQVTYSGVLTLE